MKRVALAQAESAPMVLAVVAVAAVTSLIAVVFELIAAKAAGPQHAAGHIALALFTVVGSWLLMPTLFALTYAASYYGAEPDSGLTFPGAPAKVRAAPHRLLLLLLHHRRHRADVRRDRSPPGRCAGS